MRGPSRSAAVASVQALDRALDGVERSALAEELFAVLTSIEGNIPLRRALADSSREASARRELADRLYGGKVSETANTLVGEVVSQRWSSDGDLCDILESLAVRAVLAGAEQADRIDDVENELFRFERIVAADAALRDALSVRNTDAEGKASLVTTLLDGKASPETIRLAVQAVRAPRGRRLDRVLASYLALAAGRRDELTALVTVASPMTDSQQTRLASALRATYGKKVSLQIVVDSQIVGGVKVQVGDEIVDGTAARRLDAVRKDLTA